MNNTESWKEFRIGDYFDVSLASGDLKIEQCEKGDIPLVSSGTNNNGIVGYISDNNDEKAKIFTGNKITVDMFCCAFYQRNDFFAVSHGRVNILSPKFEMTSQIGIFIATLINNERYKFSYGRAVYSNEIKNMTIKMPTDTNGNPDWKFMNNYIEKLENIQRNTGSIKESLKTNNINSNQEINLLEWKEYRVGDLFKSYTGGDLIISDIQPGKIPIVSHCLENNGVANYTEVIEGRKLFDCNNTISVADRGCFWAFVQDKNFYIGTRVKALKSKYEKINKYILLFISTIINQESFKYSYGRNCCHGIENIVIKLPSYNNEPNWEYMENYIKALPYGDRI